MFSSMMRRITRVLGYLLSLDKTIQIEHCARLPSHGYGIGSNLPQAQIMTPQLFIKVFNCVAQGHTRLNVGMFYRKSLTVSDDRG